MDIKMSQCPFFPQSTNNQTLKMGLLLASTINITYEFRNGHHSVVFALVNNGFHLKIRSDELTGSRIKGVRYHESDRNESGQGINLA